MMDRNSRVWVMRANYGRWAEDFANNGYIGIHHGMDGADLSAVTSRGEVRRLFIQEHPGETSERSIGIRAGQVAKFHLDIRVGDYVLTPGLEGKLYYGTFTTDYTYYVSGDDGLPCRNRRDVEWSKVRLVHEGLQNIVKRHQQTFSELSDENKRRFFSAISEASVGSDRPKLSTYRPEDSWVPFHLEVGQKLIEGEWRLEEKREEFAKMTDRIRQADPFESSNKSDLLEKWVSDPLSFYVAFSRRKDNAMRREAFEETKRSLNLRAVVPERSAPGIALFGRSYPRWNPRLKDNDVDFMWKFFKFAYGYDPRSGTPETDKLFTDYFDRASENIQNANSGVFSYFLFLIDPTKYVRIGKLKDLKLSTELGITLDRVSGTKYLDGIRRLWELGEKHNFTLLDVNRTSTTREILGLDGDDFYTDGDDFYTIDHALRDGLFFERSEIQGILDRFEDKNNLILQGPPGVGKTFVSKRLAYALMGERADERIRNVQFHQSYSYEDFVQGYRPTTNDDDQLVFKRESGTFMRLCKRAAEEPDVRFVMIIDEINRGNLSRVFGELLSLIEKDKRGDALGVELSSGQTFSVPENVYILGTMNLADRSLSGMDYAMRRRFAFASLKPQFGETVFKDWLNGKDVPNDIIIRINDRMSALNDVIGADASLGRNFAVGHSYFCDLPSSVGNEDWDEWYRNIVRTEIQPLLEEYWFDDLKKADEEVDRLLSGVE